MRPLHGLWVAALLGSLVACDPAGQAPTTSGAPTTASQPTSKTPAASTGSTAKAAYPDEDLPVAADFEAAADKEIDEGNYLDKLGEIEAELGGGAPKATKDAGTGK